MAGRCGGPNVYCRVHLFLPALPLIRHLLVTLAACPLLYTFLPAQPWNDKTHLSRQDTLRGSVTAERKWWDLLHYDLRIKPDYATRTIRGHNTITYQVVERTPKAAMQLDLQPPLRIDSVRYDGKASVSFTRTGSVWYLHLPGQRQKSVHSVTVYYSGTPHPAANPPWDGGWVWAKDSLDRPWMTTACQGIGASTWYPCKDHQGDEPDRGASLSITVNDPLVGVANGRLQSVTPHGDRTTTYQWVVTQPINNYNLCPYIGAYVNLHETYPGEKGDLEMSYWVLDYNREKVLSHLAPQARRMMKSFEGWFGPYPFYEDSYKLVDAPGYGMEHQSAVAYYGYRNGNRGKDYSGTGWGLHWDFLLVHESAHEWFGNSITAADPADKWLHEGFACYADVLFMHDYLGERAGNEYVVGTRRNIWNDEPIIGPYGVGKEGSSDMYPKARNLLHMLRALIGDDAKFRNILRGMNSRFYHRTVTSSEVEDYFSREAGKDFSQLFDQYLRTTQVPVLEYAIKGGVLAYRYTNCLPGFAMPVRITAGADYWLTPTTAWQQMPLPAGADTLTVDDRFYIGVEKR